MKKMGGLLGLQKHISVLESKRGKPDAEHKQQIFWLSRRFEELAEAVKKQQGSPTVNCSCCTIADLWASYSGCRPSAAGNKAAGQTGQPAAMPNEGLVRSHLGSRRAGPNKTLQLLLAVGQRKISQGSWRIARPNMRHKWCTPVQPCLWLACQTWTHHYVPGFFRRVQFYNIQYDVSNTTAFSNNGGKTAGSATGPLMRLISGFPGTP